MEKYDIKTETWSFGPNMKRKRAGAGICVCDGKIYVAGMYGLINRYERWFFFSLNKATQGNLGLLFPSSVGFSDLVVHVFPYSE